MNMFKNTNFQIRKLCSGVMCLSLIDAPDFSVRIWEYQKPMIRDFMSGVTKKIEFEECVWDVTHKYNNLTFTRIMVGVDCKFDTTERGEPDIVYEPYVMTQTEFETMVKFILDEIST